MGGKVKQVFFFFASWRKFREIVGLHDHVAGRAGHDPFARAFQRLPGSPCDVKQPLPCSCLDFLIQTAVSAKKPNKCHASSFSCSTAARAIRWQASTSSC